MRLEQSEKLTRYTDGGGGQNGRTGAGVRRFQPGIYNRFTAEQIRSAFPASEVVRKRSADDRQTWSVRRVTEPGICH